MPVGAATEDRPRPPARRSIQLYGPPPAHPSPSTPAPNNRSTLVVSIPGVITPGTTAYTGTHPHFSTTASTVPQHSHSTSKAAAAAVRHRVSAVSNVTAVGRGEGSEGTAAAAANEHASPRQLRGRLSEGTVHRVPQPPPMPTSATGQGVGHANSSARHPHRNTNIGKGPHYGSSVVSWVPVVGDAPRHLRRGSANTNDAASSSSPPNSRRSRGDTAVAMTEMVNEAARRNTWAVGFESAEALRRAVCTDADAYTHFEEALVAEVNMLRRAPAEYAAVVEREARVGAPYVHEDDTYFVSESAAEEAAAELRRRIEQEVAQQEAGTATASTPATSRVMTATANASNVAPRLAAAAPSASSTSAASGAQGAPPSPNVGERKKTKKRHSGSAQGQTSKDVSTTGAGSAEQRNAAAKAKPSDMEPFSQTLPPQEQPTPSEVSRRGFQSPSPGTQELTLAELRHQFRCQQRYRAALEAALRELRVAQRQAEAAQLAAWTAEDEKAQKRTRRSTAASLANPAASMGVSAHVGANGASSSSVKKMSSASSMRRGSPAMDDIAFLRRSEEAAMIHRVYEQRVHRLEEELERARGACQRSLAGGNLISSAVRALREAQPAPPLKQSRGLSLAARDTAEMYYGDEERVAALGGLFAIARATLAGLPEPSATSPKAGRGPSATAAPSTLEELSIAQECRGTDLTMASGMIAPSGVLSVLSEEALLLAEVAQKACTTYGYISNAIRGAHIQGVGTPRAVILQLIVGCLTPVLGVAHQPSSADASTDRVKHLDQAAAAATDDAHTATQCFAGMRLEGQLYAAQPESIAADQQKDEFSSPHEDAPAGAFMAQKRASAFWGDGGPAANSSHAKEAAQEATRRLWPLLWPAASTIGCGWRQVRGWRHVPTYEEACRQIDSEKSSLAIAQSHASAGSEMATANAFDDFVPGGETAVVCSTVLLASGFEEFEAGRACAGMTPAATRRAILELTQGANDNGGDLRGVSASGKHGSDGARRAAVEVHSRLGVSLLTPTMHPLLIPAPPSHSLHDGGPVICAAVRVPYERAGHTRSQADGASRKLSFSEEAALPATIRVVAQVTAQSGPTPLYPSADSTEVLTQRSPVDPSVWLILVDAAAAFARSGISTASAEERRRETGKSTGEPSPLLALHLFAKDLCDPTGGYEHVAFIRLQQSHDADASQRATATGQGCHSVLIAPEWRYLLKGLSCVPSPMPAAATSASGVRATILPRAALQSGGWAVLHEPLLGRNGVVLHPLASDFRAGAGGGSSTGILDDDDNDHVHHGGALAAGARDVHPGEAKLSVLSAFDEACWGAGAPVAAATSSPSAAAVAARGDRIYVAVQLPANANALWWHHRMAALRAARDKLEAEMAVEEDGVGNGKATGSITTTAKEGTHPGAVQDTGVPSETQAGALAVSQPPPTNTDGTDLPVAEDATKTSNSNNNASVSASFFTPSMPPSLSATAAEATAVVLAAVAAVVTTADEGDAAKKKKKPAEGRAVGKAEVKEKPAAAANDGDGSPRVQKSGKGSSRAAARAGGGGGAAAPSPTFVFSSPTKGGSSSISGSPPTGVRRLQSFHLLSGAPESAALREYEAVLQSSPASRTVTGASPSESAAGVHPNLQATRISLAALSALNARLRVDADLWAAHLQRLQPFLDSERERLAWEAAKRKGKEQQRLQHDQDDMAREMAGMQHRTEAFQHAVRTTWEALRKRERAQVLRRARLARVMEELSGLEAAMHTQDGVVGMAGVSVAAPRITLRLFNGAAVAVGSGRNVAAVHAGRQDQQTTSGSAVRAAGLESGDSGALAARAPPAAVAAGNDAVVLQPLPSQAVMRSGLPGVVYAASCTVPASFFGQATLLIDDEVAVTWTL